MILKGGNSLAQQRSFKHCETFFLNHHHGGGGTADTLDAKQRSDLDAALDRLEMGESERERESGVIRIGTTQCDQMSE